MRAVSTGLLALAALSSGNGALGQAWTPMWLHEFGTTSADRIAAGVVAEGGASLFAGTTSGTISLPRPGGADAFLVRCEPSGAITAMGQYGTPQADTAEGMATDGAGGVLLAGETSGSFGGPNLGESDIYVARVDPQGALLWVRQFGSTEDEDAWDAASDGAGGIYVVGQTSGDLAAPIAGSVNAFITRYDGQGNQLWSIQFGNGTTGGSGASAHGACPDGENGLFVCGWMSGGVSFLPFIARYGPTGDRLWIRHVGRTSADSLWAVTPDGMGGVIAGGSSVDSTFVTASDIMLVRFDANGSNGWFTLLSSPRSDSIDALMGDGLGGAYFTGTSFDRPAGFTGTGGRGLLGQVDHQGNLRWGRMFGSTINDDLVAITRSQAGSILVAGVGTGNSGPSPAGSSDALIARYSLCPADLTSSALFGHVSAGVPDGLVNGDDFFYYLTLYAAGLPCPFCVEPPDLTTAGTQAGQPGYGAPDGVLSTDDFFYFLHLFAQGC